MLKENLVYLFAGEDIFRKNLSIEKFKKKLKLQSRSLDFNVYFGADSKVSDIVRGIERFYPKEVFLRAREKNIAPVNQDQN